MADVSSSPMRANAPSGSPTAYTDPQQITTLLKTTDPGAVQESGTGYQTKFASVYEKLANALLTIRSDLREAWGGEDAAAAQSSLRQLWAATTSVHRAANDFGIAIERHGAESLAWYKDNMPQPKDLAEAQSWMAGANERISQTWGSLPENVTTTLADQSPHYGHEPNGEPTTDGTSYSGPPSTGGGAGSPAGPGVGSGHHSSPYTDVPGIGWKTGDNGADLAGATLIGSGGWSGTPIAGRGLGALPGGGGVLSPGIGGSDVPGGGLVPGLGSSPFGLGRPPSSSRPISVPSRVTTGSGRGISASGVVGTEAARATETAVARMATPVGGGGVEQREEERSRQTWLSEDADVWTGGIESVPQVISDRVAGEAIESVLKVDGSLDIDDLFELFDELSSAGYHLPQNEEKGEPDKILHESQSVDYFADSGRVSMTWENA